MKKTLLSCILILCAGTVWADLPAVPSAGGAVADTPPVVRRRRPSRPSGGLLERKDAIPSRPFGIENAQKVVDAATVAEIVRKVRIFAKIPFALDAPTAPAVVRLVETDEFPGAIAVYPEAYRASVNVKVLAADGAAADVVAERLRKEIVRAALFVLGSGYSPSPCLARPVAGLDELDSLAVPMLSPETMTHLKAMPKLGIREIRFATYWQACREGWAPPPTNDIQKAIFEQVKADKERGPTNPITIQPPNKKK